MLPTALVAPPETIAIVQKGALLRLHWAQGGQQEVDAFQLRSGCRCARCVRARVEGRTPACGSAVTITNVALVGEYAVNIAFSDGHERGIFPWAYLRMLGRDFSRPPV